MSSRFFKFAGTCSAAIAAAVLWSASANATLISIGLQQTGVNGGVATTVATDGGSGTLAFNGSYGTFNFNTITAQGAPAMAQGSLSSNSIQTSSTAGGVITVYITETGLTSPTGSTVFTSSFTANSFFGNATSVVESTLVSTTNDLYAGTQMAAATFTAIGTSVIPNTITVPGTYSETTKYVITVGSGGGSVNDTILLSAAAVPEPASLTLLGVGLVGLGVTRLRRGRRNAAAAA